MTNTTAKPVEGSEVVARHAFMYLMARALPAILGVATLAVFTRLLSPSEYGKYAVLLAAVGFANAGLFWWLRLGLLRYFSGYQGRQDVFLSTIVRAFLSNVAITLVVATLVWLTIPLPHVGWFFWAGVGLLCVQAAFELVQEFARCQFSPLRFGILALARVTVLLALGTVFALLGMGAGGLCLALVVALLAPALVSGYAVFREARTGLVDPALLRSLVHYGFPLAGAFGLNVVIDSSDRLLIAALLDTKSAGIYSASYELSQRTLVVLMNVVYLAAYPLLMRTFDTEGAEVARARLAANQSLLLAVGLPILLTMVLLPDDITRTFFGTRYLHGAPVVPWIATSAFLQGMRSYHTDLSFQLAKRTSRLVVVAAVAAILNVGLNFALIPLYGIEGAAYATFASYSVALALSWALGRRAFPLPRLGSTDLKIFAALVPMAVVLCAGGRGAGLVPLVTRIACAFAAFAACSVIANTGNVRERLRRRLQGARIGTK